ncbi:MAG: tetratricopeptide repeat protein [Candidatus Aenigmarchaeota archaeon]|nr:tetratricopeptide repeat protein [Candidatus Aenigmarchaeota archaeon]
MKKFCLGLLFFICYNFITNTVLAYSGESVNLYNKGIECVKNKEYVQAADNFKKAINEDPSLTDAYFNLGSVYNQLGETDKAIDILNLLMRKNPFDDEAAFFLSGLYFDKEEYNKALIYLNSISKFSEKYDKSQELIHTAEKKFIEKKLAAKKTDWEKKVIENFKGPTGVATDSAGNIYAANYNSGIINKFSSDRILIKTFSNENIQGPIGLAVDSADNIYVANYISNNLVKISQNKDIEDIKVILDNINKPYYLFINDDILYVTEQENNSLIMLNLDKL